ncbi:hypothetical protein OG455_00320 [Kitasatospora sp. NBC_01287]|uniref:hypothetical protein n=1 Tax=Kitasatospora sp. NBC_01287 TaxID=2903573 RepID=UPI0022523452|nr:hypothetical protein [Kitasatospora sp. NBC_01287]MCX4743970.1 hypothetical protein [Kitasatospora sp. NBC_01287]
MTTTTEVRLFAYRQGPLRAGLAEQPQVDGTAPTTATLPPTAARGAGGRPLPAGTHRLLAGARYPRPLTPGAVQAVPPGDLVGHLLLAAVGLQRREPSNRFNDHRSIASVRSKFPVHVFVLAPDGACAYLDLYRHALVDLPDTLPDALPDAVAADGGFAHLLPAAGDLTVLLAARYTDLPALYGRLRCALSLLELGINLRALHIAADLLGVRVRLRSDGRDTAAAARLLAGSGPGAWSPPLVVTLQGVGPLAPSRPLPSAAASDLPQHEEDRALLRQQAGHATVLEAAEVTAPLAGLSCAAAEPVRGVPDLAAADPGTVRPTWAETLWNRSAGRAPAVVSGFSARPTVLGGDCLADMLAWIGRSAPGPLLAEVGRKVRTTVALQRLAGLPTGRYALVEGRLECEQEDPGLPQRLQDAFGYPLTPTTDCGLRHATAMWVFSADLDAILDAFGPAGWSLLQLWCGWASHGLATAAAAHGLFARPARSFDEFWLQRAMGLPREVFPVFTVICGRSRFAEPMLDLRA